MNAPTVVDLIPVRDPWPSARERWMDISSDANHQFNAFLGLDANSSQSYDYPSHAQVRLTFDAAPSVPYFVGRIDATGLKPNFAYQLKLAGKPVRGTRGWGAYGDDVANERIGYAGRWWCDSYHATQTNFDDTHYVDYYKNAAPGTEHNIYGYLFMGDFVTDHFGAAHVNVNGHYSYHITWADWQGGSTVLAGTFPVNGGLISSNPPIYYGYGSAAPNASVSLYYEYEAVRSQAQGVTLPPGTYHCRLLVTEESFHSSDTYGGFWKTVLGSEDLQYDSQGNVTGPDQSTANDVTFRIAAPLCTIVTPAPGSAVTRLSSIAGTVQSPSAGSVTSLMVQLGRDAAGGGTEYWNGSAWGGTATNLNAVLSGSNWSLTSGLPSGLNLTDGRYQAQAMATDSSGNVSDPARSNFLVDTTAPLLTFTSPGPGGALSRISQLTGTSTDGGSGVARVDLRLYRVQGGSFSYWDGAAWVASPVNLATVFAASNWSRRTGLPAGSNLPDGSYFLSAFAWDRLGNQRQATITFKVDTVVPATLTISSPLNQSAVRSLPIVKGTATDNAGGSGIARVEVRLFRPRSGGGYEYWDGTAWVTAIVNLSTTLSGSNWSRSSNLPAGADLADGMYSLQVYAWDRAGQMLSRGASFRVDAVKPVTLTVSTPANGSTIISLPGISGSVADNTGGSGITRVALWLYRAKSGGGYEYWDGSTWGPAAALTTALSGSTWNCSSVLPAGSDLPAGGYRLMLDALDRAGNRLRVGSSFSVQ